MYDGARFVLIGPDAARCVLIGPDVARCAPIGPDVARCAPIGRGPAFVLLHGIDTARLELARVLRSDFGGGWH